MELGARDIHEKQFHDAWRGYNQREVDDFLDRVAETVDRLHRENTDLKERIAELDQAVAASRDTEEMLKKTLVTAQRAAEEAIANAKQKANEIVTQAEEKVKSTESESRERVTRLEAEARGKVAEAERQLTTKRRDLDESISKLRALEADIKQRLKAFLEQQLRTLDSITGPDAARHGPPSARPAMQRPEEARVPGGSGGGPETGEETAGGARAERGAPVARTQEGRGDTPEAEGADDEEPGSRERGVRDLFYRNQG